MTRLVTCLCLIISNVPLASTAFAQQLFMVDSDYRIVKCEKDFAKYLHEDKRAISAIKLLEIVSDTTGNTKLLVVRFGLAGDDVPRYWGILNNKEKYFFYDADDNDEADLIAFKKQYDARTVATVLFFCFQDPNEDYGFVPIANGKFQRNLTLIRTGIHNLNEANASQVRSAILFLENITGIKARTNDKRFEGLFLTTQDYTRWLNWYKKNYSRLIWDAKKQVVKVK